MYILPRQNFLLLRNEPQHLGRLNILRKRKILNNPIYTKSYLFCVVLKNQYNAAYILLSLNPLHLLRERGGGGSEENIESNLFNRTLD